ncbi:MAG: DUF397 domain-containing protein [Actinophytocola sp.]|uniref:DUF397 domain-containing protein n=1 Tax=Actinophytocola sp. TaxID=1872138 RepID=UPI003C72E935
MTWRSSTYSDSSGNCVQVRGDLAALRDSKDKGGPVLPAPSLGEFVQNVKTGRYDR